MMDSYDVKCQIAPVRDIYTRVNSLLPDLIHFVRRDPQNGTLLSQITVFRGNRIVFNIPVDKYQSFQYQLDIVYEQGSFEALETEKPVKIQYTDHTINNNTLQNSMKKILKIIYPRIIKDTIDLKHIRTSDFLIYTEESSLFYLAKEHIIKAKALGEQSKTSSTAFAKQS